MTQEIDNYARFYALLRKLPGADKDELVYRFTDGRTTHLHLMAREEYDSMCRLMEQMAGHDERRARWRQEMKRWRSTCLRLMQQLGIDTTDWARVNDFCMNPRIAGKPFARITLDGLEALAVKLRSIRRKGGLKPMKETNVKQPGKVTYVIIDPNALKC